MVSTSKRIGFTVAAVVCLIVAPGLSAARLPDWAERIAADAPNPERRDVGDTIYMLLSDEQVTVQPDGTFNIRQRYATQIVSAAQRTLSYRFPFNKEAVVRSARAWHLRAGHMTEGTGLAPVPVEVEESTLTGQRLRRVEMSGLRPGSLVFFEFETTIRPSLLTLSKRFFEDAPVREARLELITPPGWSVKHTWVRHAGPEPRRDGDARLWEIRDLPAPAHEALSEPASWRAPQLAVNLLPPAGAEVATPAVPDWSTFSAWYDDLSRGVDEATPEIRVLALGVVTGDSPNGAGASEMARIQSAARWVRDHIRYIPPRRGVGVSLLPRPASQTLASGYGDCKDMGTLFRALLAVRGIRSYPLLVHASETDTLSEDVPAWGFDHYVVGVPLPAGAAIPAHFAGAIVTVEGFGPLLVIDTTHTDLSVGSLSASLAGKRALLVAGREGRLVSLPRAEASAHRIERTVEAELDGDHTLNVTVTSRLMGQPAVSARGALRESAASRQADAEREAVLGWPGARVTGYRAEVETPEGAFVETVTLNTPSGSVPQMRARLFAGADGALPRVALDHRTQAVVYDYPRSIRYDVTLRGVPPEALPEDTWERKASGWSARRTVTRVDGTVRATWDLTVAQTRFEPETFSELDDIYTTAVATASAELPF